MQKQIIAVAFVIIATTTTFAQQNSSGLSSADQQALQQTKELLTNKNQRESALTTESAKAADSYVKSLGGAQHSEDIYNLASQVFEKLVKKYNGDANKIAEILEKAKTDPAGFANSEFTAEELAALKALAQKLPKPAPSHK